MERKALSYKEKQLILLIVCVFYLNLNLIPISAAIVTTDFGSSIDY